MKDDPEHSSLPLPAWFVEFARGFGLEPAALAERVLRKFVETPRTQICVGFRDDGGRGGPRRGGADFRRPLTAPKLARAAR